ncbi:uncharacterized protein VTP21DRAFT_1998 [Calcarisporiella thermophila]|uniref:uncharacterized protein n=1 Tax=Calcarisporiella thermophila TaxID=911321 RepID=UPI00374402B9
MNLTIMTAEKSQSSSPAADPVAAAAAIAANLAKAATNPALPTWVQQVPMLTLTEEQRANVEKAKIFARELQGILLKARTQAPLNLPDLVKASYPALVANMDIRTYLVLCRIYIGSINFELTEAHLRAVFQQFGPIRDTVMGLDPSTGKHKGFCFMEFETPEAAAMAVERMDNAELGGRQLKVGRPTNFNTINLEALPKPPSTRIYVANVNEHIGEEHLSTIFEAFGKLNACVLVPNLLTRKHKGYGFVEFENETASTTAAATMNNFELAGLPLLVRKAVAGGPLGQGMKALEDMPAQPIGSIPSSEIPPSNPAATAKAHSAAARISANLAKQGHIGDDSVAKEENVSIKGEQRYAIMQKLARKNESRSVVLIRNAVPVSELDDTLEEEFAEECQNYGDLERVLIYSVPPNLISSEAQLQEELGGADMGRAVGDGDVRIFAVYKDAEGAERCREIMHHRWFGGRRLIATMYDTEKFDAKDFLS